MKKNQVCVSKSFQGPDKDAPNIVQLLQNASVLPIQEDVSDRGGLANATMTLERVFGANKLTLTAEVSVVCGSSEAEIAVTTLQLNRSLRAALLHELSLWETGHAKD